MTAQRSFKRLVRDRMAHTGESYTAARAQLLAPATRRDQAAAAEPPLVTSDDKIRERTGRGWESWFDLLDEWGAPNLTHREIARLVAADLAVAPLAWAAQAVTTSYERARGRRVVGQRTAGFAVTATRTIAVPAERLLAAFTDPSERSGWLPELELRQRSSTTARAAHFDVGDGPGRVHVILDATGADRTTISVEHARLADVEECATWKAYWRSRLLALKARLEAGVDV